MLTRAIDDDLATAFARNIAWLAQFGPVLPRHMLFVGPGMERFRFAELAGELQRWELVLRRLPTGDYRMTPGAYSRLAGDVVQVMQS